MLDRSFIVWYVSIYKRELSWIVVLRISTLLKIMLLHYWTLFYCIAAVLHCTAYHRFAEKVPVWVCTLFGTLTSIVAAQLLWFSGIIADELGIGGSAKALIFY